jgi:hypothetical protein
VVLAVVVIWKANSIATMLNHTKTQNVTDSNG